MPSMSPGRFRPCREAALACLLTGLAVLPARADDPGLTRDPVAARAWLAAHTDLDPATVVLIGAGYAFAATPGGSEGAFEVREELSSPGLAATLGGRSATLTATLDCRQRESSVGGVRVHPDNGLRGTGQSVKATAWMRSTPVDLVDLAAALCDPTAPRPLASAAGAGPSPAALDPPPLADAGPAPEEPAPAPLATPPRTGAHWVQLGAFASEALAEAQWPKVTGLGDAGHRVETVDRNGGRLHRLLAGPYATVALATRACAAVKAAGLACLVR